MTTLLDKIRSLSQANNEFFDRIETKRGSEVIVTQRNDVVFTFKKQNPFVLEVYQETKQGKN